MSQRGSGTISWYSYNLPNTINGAAGYSSQFFYDPMRSRWKQVAQYAGTVETTISIGGLMEKVTRGTVTSWRHAIATPTEMIAQFTRDNSGGSSLQYFTHDHLGSIDSVSNVGGAAQAKLSFGAYGARRNAAGWSGNPTAGDWTAITGSTRHGYTGQEMLDNLSLVHLNGRVYDPTLGRFLSADPYVPYPTNSQSFNRYSYVRNDPLSFVDPSGFAENCQSGQTPISDPNNPDVTSQVTSCGTVPLGPPKAFLQPNCGGIGIGAPEQYHVAISYSLLLDFAKGQHYLSVSWGGFCHNVYYPPPPKAGGFSGGGVTPDPSNNPEEPQMQKNVWRQGDKTEKPNSRKCVNYAQLGAGVFATGLGAIATAGGTIETFVGLAGAPETLGATALIAVKGITDVGLGAVAVKDGLSLIDTALDGVQRPSTFAQVGQRIGGETGAAIGDTVSLGLGLKGFADAANRRIGKSAYAANLVNTILSTILPDSLLPCQ